MIELTDEDKITHNRRLLPDGSLMPADADWEKKEKRKTKLPLEVVVAEYEEKTAFLENCPYFSLSECYCSDLFYAVFERRIHYTSDVIPFEDRMSAEYLNWREQKRQGKKVIDYRGYACWRYNPIVFYKDYSSEDKKVKNVHRVVLKDDDETIRFLDDRQFAIMAPVTFVGRNNTAQNARYMYAFVIDLDGVGSKQLVKLFWMMSNNDVPVANIIVNSGHGVHLYYILDAPVPLYRESKTLLDRMKHGLTNVVWDENTSYEDTRQYQSVLQGFRLPGTLTKFGKPIRAFYNSDASLHSLESLNDYLDNSKLTKSELEKVKKEPVYNPTGVTLQEAERRWPEWYAWRIKEKKRVGKKWNVNRALYDWWLNKMRTTEKEIQVSHRYWCILTLVVYAVKCDVPREEVLADAYSLVDKMESYTFEEDNHFTKEDVNDAMRAFDMNYCKWPIHTIEETTYIHIERNRRNGRKQEEHLKRARFSRDLDHPDGWMDGNGRKTEIPENSKNAAKVAAWRYNNPSNNNKSLCARETRLDRKTVRKWWNEKPNEIVMEILKWQEANPNVSNVYDCANATKIPRSDVRKWWWLLHPETVKEKKKRVSRSAKAKTQTVSAEPPLVLLNKLFAPDSTYAVEGYSHEESIEIVTSGKWKELGWDIAY